MTKDDVALAGRWTDADKLADALRRMRWDGRDGRLTAMTRLFGVIFADQIQKPQSIVDAYKANAKATGGGGDWPGQPNEQEIRVGMTLAPYVSPAHHLVRKYRG